MSATSSSVCVVGGGPAGLACCATLRQAGVRVCLVQESRGVGGKLCTKYAGKGGKKDPTLHFDMGVQMFKPHGEMVEAVKEVVAPWPAPGRFVELAAPPTASAGIHITRRLPTEGLVVGVPTMSRVGRHLLERVQGIDGAKEAMEIHLDRTAVVHGKTTQGEWLVRWGQGRANNSQLRTRPELQQRAAQEQGAFDAVILAFEANKIKKGCGSGYKQVGSSSTPRITRALREVRTGQVWNLMLAFASPVGPLDWDAAVIVGNPTVAWMANDSSKPGRAVQPECWMAFSTIAWASKKRWSKREVEQQLREAVCGLLKRATGGRKLPRVVFTEAGRWGNSTLTCTNGVTSKAEFPARCLLLSEEKKEPAPPESVWDRNEQMGACGDWAAGFSVSDAYASGVTLANEILQNVGSTKRTSPQTLSGPEGGVKKLFDGQPARPSSVAVTAPGIPDLASTFNMVDTGLVAATLMDETFTRLLESEDWQDLGTKRSHRKVMHYTFSDRRSLPPPHLAHLTYLIEVLLRQLELRTPQDSVRPIQCFLCLYERTTDSCPEHRHNCRQLTMSMGAPRTLTVEGQAVAMRHGDVVVLGGEQHGVPRVSVDGQSSNKKPRISINLFYATASDYAKGPVSVNANRESAARRQAWGSGGSGHEGDASTGQRALVHSRSSGVGGRSSRGDRIGRGGVGTYERGARATSSSREASAGVKRFNNNRASGNDAGRRFKTREKKSEFERFG
mmetsp:Transcript_54446/g.74420  ORF Transcript_54446/g.74420 Transcript_54446/m.74420 type:complete len:731 (-) Transcript_54446:238-2430(-)|eukprot:CAMPEP_0185782558 /NCGR_PEP_ID=MMETSP1174-20130828/109702_1 /TAXON_ID=35687 /ORGANISM="Dictyocha speculum, Strain CCMP1381" /LENGTH=730 /DNA_ID=CAMNT_0028473067 /DNA_START=99 /DNA_END=2291 /DNA_ORIENTATION=+